MRVKIDPHHDHGNVCGTSGVFCVGPLLARIKLAHINESVSQWSDGHQRHDDDGYGLIIFLLLGKQHASVKLKNV